MNHEVAMGWAIVTPIILAGIYLEMLYVKHKRGRTDGIELSASICLGILNMLHGLLGLSIFAWLMKTYEIKPMFQLENHWWLYVIGFIWADFLIYWIHRISHAVNIFWNDHLIHHSGEFFNIATTFRQPFSGFAIPSLTIIPMLTLQVLGFPMPIVLAIIGAHLFAQIWYHTETIGKMGFWENIIMTPSAHRVHHAMNPEYIDKNFSAVFVVWDKWFGTFQPELENVPPVYGITEPSRTYNPLYINYQQIIALWKDAWHTKSWKDKLLIWWKPTGWRPDDVKDRYPRQKIENVNQYIPYMPDFSVTYRVVAYVCFCGILVFLMYFLLNYQKIDTSPPILANLSNIWLFSGLLIGSIFVYMFFIGKKKYSMVLATFYSALVIALFFSQNMSFWSDLSLSSGWVYLIVLFCLTSVAMMWFIGRKELFTH